MFRGAKTALDQAVAEARQHELEELTRQMSLFEGYSAAGSAAQCALPTRRGPGRPMGARNKRTNEAARIYIAEFGDPLRRGVAISALPILAAGVLEGLARRLGCSRHDAAKWWATIYAATMPFVHQRLATLSVRPEGSPDGEPVEWTFAEDGDLIELTSAERPIEAR